MLIYVIWGIYIIFLAVLIFGWLKKNRLPLNTNEYSINVVVPFRNEAKNLEQLIKSLRNQTYDKFIVTFIDDHSEDESVQMIKDNLLENGLNWKLIQLTDREGKKAAIDTGIKSSDADIVVTTDADCWMGKSWLTLINAAFDEETKMVVGRVSFMGNESVFNAWQQLEFSTLIGTGGAMINLNVPIMCNGANLAYRKATFEKVNGFVGIEQSPSGDDELLMSKFSKAFPKSIMFLGEEEAVVYTRPSKTWRQFMQQRKRWASKWSMNKRPANVSMALLVFLFHLSFLSMVVMAGLGEIPPQLLALLLGIKLLLEYIFVRLINQKSSKRFSFISFLLSQVFYSFYTVFFGLLANFGKYEWKGRTYKT